MKNIKYLSLVLLGVLGLAISCADDKELVPVWESAVHGFGTITSSAQDFKRDDPSVGLDFELQWISIDGKASVTKIDVYILWNEDYIDNDGNPAVASHGGEDGRLYRTFEGGAAPGNRTPVTFSITHADMFALYSGSTFDYKDGTSGNAIDVFSYNTSRDAVKRFVSEDKFTVRWEFTTSDGRVFSAWSPSVCTEFPGANCQINFGVVCADSIFAPAGDWKFDMVDTYGDGWQGGYIEIEADGAEFDRAFILTQYVSQGGDGIPRSSGTKTVTIPSSVTSLRFIWHDDSYNSECQFKITSPKGNVVADVKVVSAGEIKLNLCKE